MATAAGLVCLTLVYWLGVAVFTSSAVTLSAWLILYAVCVAACLGLWRARPRWSGTRFWALAAFYAVLLAAIFYGANGGLDALYGPERKKTEVAGSFGGLELWFVLFPGVFSLAVASFFHAWLMSRGARLPKDRA